MRTVYPGSNSGRFRNATTSDVLSTLYRPLGPPREDFKQVSMLKKANNSVAAPAQSPDRPWRQFVLEWEARYEVGLKLGVAPTLCRPLTPFRLC